MSYRNLGTTSACAENTVNNILICRTPWNYLRVRGEYKPPHGTAPASSELPPRARRIRGLLLPHQRAFGTTSACAENTVAPHRIVSVGRNYLRVRGEYANPAAESAYGQELPPRARRIHGHITVNKTPKGTTSACAENTKPRIVQLVGNRNYLRVRGEYPRVHT